MRVYQLLCWLLAGGFIRTILAQHAGFTGLMCDPGWLLYEGSCYKLVDASVTWKEAEGACATNSTSPEGTLAPITTYGELAFLKAYYADRGELWIGLKHDANQKRPQWSDDSVIFTPCLFSDALGYEFVPGNFCYAISINGIAALNCSEERGYICHRRAEFYHNHPNVPQDVCSPSGFRVGEKCFSIAFDIVTRAEGEQLCTDFEGGIPSRLAALNSSQESRLVQAHIFAHYMTSLWLGARRDPVDGKFYWDGPQKWELKAEDLDLTWIHQDPEKEKEGDCVVLLKEETREVLRVESCNATHAPLCASLVTDHPTPGTLSPLHCLQNSCYWESSFPETWEFADRYCEHYGGHLATFPSLRAEQQIKSKLTNPSNIFIGLFINASQPDPNRWSDGSRATYQNWSSRRSAGPHTSGDYNHCGILEGNRWKLSYCNSLRRFLCEIPIGYKNKPPVGDLPRPQMVTCPGGSFDSLENSGWFRRDNYCYMVHMSQLTWKGAETTCTAIGGHLVSIRSQEETDFLIRLVSLHGGPPTENRVWIGLSRRGFRDGLGWSEPGSPLDYVNWDQGEPNGLDGEERCVNMYWGHGRWNDEQCSRELPFICRRPLVPNTNIPQPPTRSPLPPEGTLQLPDMTGCEPGWLPFGEMCYYSDTYGDQDRVSWHQAQSRCEEMGANLISIHNEKQQAMLTFQSTWTHESMWLGMFLLDHHTFAWADNTPVDFTNWAMDFPVITGAEPLLEQCVVMVYDKTQAGRWENTRCSASNHFACQKPRNDSLKEVPFNFTRCSNGWFSFFDICVQLYYGSENEIEWAEAEVACRTHGGHLLTINSEIINHLIAFLALDLDMVDFWVGLHTGKDRAYEWISGLPVEYSAWAANEPYHEDYEQRCGAVVGLLRYWSSEDCLARKAYICEIRENAVVQPSPEPSELVCPPSETEEWEDWDANVPYCYHMETSLRSWFMAHHSCLVHGGNLASIHSSKENKAIHQHILNLNMSFWIGLQRGHEGFIWSDQSGVNFVNWHPHESMSPREECVEMRPDSGQWNDVHCDVFRGVICAIHKVPKIPLKGEEQNGSKQSPKESSSGYTAAVVISTLILVTFCSTLVVFYFRRWRRPGRERLLSSSSSQNITFENALYRVDCAEEPSSQL